MAEIEGIEIPDELLEKIAGGKLTPEERDKIYQFVGKLKSAGLSKESAIQFSRPKNPMDYAEYMAIVDEIYGN